MIKLIKIVVKNKILLTFFILFGISKLVAQTYVVTGVKSHDTLNMRAEPKFNSKKVGELIYNASGIIRKDCKVIKSKNTSNKWCNIEYKDIDGIPKQGWVNAKYLQKDTIVHRSINQKTGISKPFVNQGHTNYIETIDANDKYIVTGAADGTMKIWTRKKVTLLKSIQAHVKSVDAVLIDNDTIISGGGDNLIKIWDLKSGTLIRTLKGHNCYISSLAVDTNIIVSGSGSYQMGCSDGDVKVWNKTNGGLIKTFKGHIETKEHDDKIETIIMDNNYIVAVGENYEMDEKWYKIWLRTNGQLKYQKKYSMENFTYPDAEPQQNTMDTFKLYYPKDFNQDVKQRFKEKKEIEDYFTEKSNLDDHNPSAFFLDKENIICGMSDGKIKIYSKKEKELLENVSSFDVKVTSVAQHGDKIVSVSINNKKEEWAEQSDKKIHVWSLNKAILLQTIDTDDNITTIDLNKEFIVTGHDERIMKIWSLKNGKLLNVVDVTTCCSDSLHVKDGIVSLSSKGGDIELYALSDKRLIRTIKTEDYLRSNHVQSDTSIIVVEGDYISIFSKETGKILKKIKFNFGNPVDPVFMNHINLLLEENTLVTTELARSNLGAVASWDPIKIRLIDLNNGKMIKELDRYELIDVPVVENGSIKLFKSQKNEDFIRFLALNDQWLIVTPEGYFNGSAGALKHLNITKYTEHGMEPFDFSQLYDHFFRPDLVKLKLSGDEEVFQKATKGLTYQDALKNPPPKLAFKSIDNKETNTSGFEYKAVDTKKEKVNLTFNVKEHDGGGVGLIRVYQEGKLIQTIGKGKVNKQSANIDAILEQEKLDSTLKENQRTYIASLSKSISGDVNISTEDTIAVVEPKTTINESGTYELELELKSGKNEISIEAFNKTNTVTSYRENITINADIPKQKPKLYAIVAGVNEFEAPSVNNLKYSQNDAQAIKEAAEQKMNTVFDEVEVTYLTGEKVSKANILKSAQEISKKAKLDDTVLFYISTHGRAAKGKLYLVPHNNKSVKNWIDFEQTFQAVQSIKALNQIFIIDACESGKANDIVSSVYDSRASVLAKSSGVHMLLATTKGTSAFEHPDPTIKNGVFTHRILEAMNNKTTDANKDSLISILELSKKLKEAQNNADYQYPVIRNVGKDVELERVGE